MLINILFWVSIISGGILILMMILSLVGGLDIDVDIETPDVDTDAGGLGLVKGFLTFLSTASWVMKILIHSNKNIGVAIGIGVITGIACFLLLNYIFKLLLKNESNVNWKLEDAMYKKGKVYLKIPASNDASGIIQVQLNKAVRELKARTKDNVEIETGDTVLIVDVDGEHVIVTKETS